MNLQALSTLRAILVHGSFTAAGEAVGCTTSAVSLQVKQLEGYFGRPLFDRSTRVPRPNAFAVELAGVAGDFAQRLGALRVAPSRQVEGLLRLGVITSMQSDMLPPALQLIGERHPGLDVRVPPLNDSDELLAELRAGRIDAALLVRPDGGGSSRLAWHELRRQPYVALAPRDAAEKDARNLLLNRGWVGYDTSLPAGRVAARLVRSLVPGKACKMELRSLDAIVSMVSLGLGVAVLPHPRQRLLDAYGLRAIALGRQAPTRRIALAWRRADDGDRRLAAVARAFGDTQQERMPAGR